jgi:uncharacterized C2H2 Zn-finger protein
MTQTDEPITCPECGDTFPTRAEFEQHEHAQPLAWEHATVNFPCEECGAAFDEADELITHQATAHASVS